MDKEKKVPCPKCGKINDTKTNMDKFWRGICIWCNMKEERLKDIIRESEMAIENGEACSSFGAICPHCGDIDEDAWELSNDEQVIDCGSCNKKYKLSKEFSVEYRTWKIDDEESTKP